MKAPEGASVKKRVMAEQSESQTSKTDAGSRGPLGVILGKMDSRWRKWWIRGIFTLIMITAFSVVVYLGPVALSLLVLAILLKCFQEIITIGYSKYKEYNLPLYRVLNWYFLLVATYFLYGDNFYYYYPDYFTRGKALIDMLYGYHRISCFGLYVSGFVLFVLTLKKDYYQIQFGMFAWTHLTMFLLGTQAYLIMQNIFESPFWFLLPVSMVVCNDIMAYLFGFFFGRTSLIKLSPNKTWEGFLGGFVSTVIFGFVFAFFLASYDFFICYGQNCGRSYFFVKTDYNLGFLILHTYPAVLHSLVLSVFASLIAPFGGFFASGFKRAFNVKDFADLIPGHGGIMDRFDCQILMATFANVYYYTFCRTANSDKLLTILLAIQDPHPIISKTVTTFCSVAWAFLCWAFML